MDTVEPLLTATSLLRPLFLAAQQNDHTFSCKKPSLIRSPANTAKFFWPIGDRINQAVLWINHYNYNYYYYYYHYYYFDTLSIKAGGSKPFRRKSEILELPAKRQNESNLYSVVTTTRNSSTTHSKNEQSRSLLIMIMCSTEHVYPQQKSVVVAP